MGWIFGYVSYNDRSIPDGVSQVHERGRRLLETRSAYIVCGGPEPTCMAEADGDLGWIACGLGLELDDRGSRVWSSADWRSGLTGAASRAPRSGHFVIIRWNSEEIEVQTDPLGLRTIFFCESGGGLFFSTRLDWITRATGRTSLDLATLGSRFLAFTQLSYDSGIEGIDRLGPGGLLRYSRRGLERTENPWMASGHDDEILNSHEESAPSPGQGSFVGDAPSTAITSAIKKLVHPHTGQNQVPVSLGLSGGVDSRTLLALALGRANLASHVFGYRDEPDVVVARALAEREGLPCRWFDCRLPETDRCADLLSEFVAVTSGFGFASDLIEKRHYSEICNDGTFLLFGLGGELLRRQFLNRFLMFGGRRALKRGDRDTVRRLLIGDGSGALRPDALNALRKGAGQHVELLFESLPDARSIGPENWTDLLMTRFRVSNPHMAHQTLLDHLGCGYSPYEDEEVLERLFSIRIKSRNNSRLSRRIIAEKDVLLKKLPFVMEDILYPFWMPTSLAIVWARLRSRSRTTSLERARMDLLSHIEEFVRDVASSRFVADDPVYDVKILRREIESFYAGETSAAKSVEDWLTFTLWRQSLEGTR